MSGHVRQRSRGSFELRWRAGGKTRTETIKARSQREAEKELAKRVAANLALSGPARLTLGEYLPTWLAGLDLKPLTRQNYASIVRTYLEPDLGYCRLRELSASTIRAAFVKWLTRGAARSSLRQVKIVLQSCLRSALLDDLIARRAGGPRRESERRDAQMVADRPVEGEAPVGQLVDLLQMRNRLPTHETSL